MKKLTVLASSLSLGLLVPFLALAQARLDTGRGLDSAFDFILYYADRVVVVLIAISFVVFLYGVAQYVIGSGDKKADAIKNIVAGLIALVVMLSAWGLVKLFQNTFGITDTSAPTQLPKVPKN